MQKTLVFWLWNDVLEPNEICRQIKEFHNKHIGGFFIHPMPEDFRYNDFHGGMPGYLSDEYFKACRTAVDCAGELDMEVWLYDEGGWPSGTMNGEISRKYPDRQTKLIYSDGRINTVDLRPDLLDDVVVQYFINNVHEKYKQYLGDDFGKTVPGIFTDEPYFGGFDPANGYLSYSDVLAEHFEKEKNYSLYDCAMRIFRNDEQAKIDYCSVWCKLIGEKYFKPIQEWCHRNNLIFTGHFNGDNFVKDMRWLWGADIFTHAQYLDMPGCDVIWRQIHPLEPENDFSRLLASAAGGKPTISETYSVYGPDLSFAEMKYIANMQFIGGIENISVMSVHYSCREARQAVTFSNFSEHGPRWQYYDIFNDFLHRMHCFFHRTKPIVKASVPYPLKDIQCGKYDAELFEEGLKLARRQITYDYVQDTEKNIDGIKSDIELESPCLNLRTRHVKSPLGERFLLVNSGIETINFKFKAPCGKLRWFDPGDGKSSRVAVDNNGFIDCNLPFAGGLILLAVNGTNSESAEENKFIEIPLEFKFSGVKQTFCVGKNGLYEGKTVEKADDDFCGTAAYIAEVESGNDCEAQIVLPEAVRCMASLAINGSEFKRKIWGPYLWQVKLNKGRNIITLNITSTPKNALFAPEHIEFMRKNSYLNCYSERIFDFPKFMPDEKILKNAFCRIKQ